MHKVFLSLGSNVGNRDEMISEAIRLIGDRIGTIERTSNIYETDPWGFESENKFLNAVVCVMTDLSPRKLLRSTQTIERKLGRTQKSRNGIYHDRTIDIDILLYDDLHVNEPDLVIPHPLMQEREFVMKPLKEVMEV